MRKCARAAEALLPEIRVSASPDGSHFWERGENSTRITDPMKEIQEPTAARRRRMRRLWICRELAAIVPAITAASGQDGPIAYSSADSGNGSAMQVAETSGALHDRHFYRISLARKNSP